MFGLGKKNQPKEPPAETKTEVNPLAAPEIRREDIHAMPEKFLDHGLTKAGKNRNWVIYIIVLAVLAVLILAAIFLFNRVVKTNELPPNSNQNQNTNQPANANQNANTNQNTNTPQKIDALKEALLTLGELGDDYASYQEAEVVVDSTTVSDITVERAQNWFTLEDSNNQITIRQTVMEAPNVSDALTIYEVDRSNRDKQVKNDEGNFDKVAVGDTSYLYVNNQVSTIELGLQWKYLKATLTIQILKGAMHQWADIKDWAASLVKKMEQYDNDRSPVNRNTNQNKNANANSNQNANVNANTNVNSNINTQPPEGSSDQDDDDLTDREELMYGTDPKKPDTDADTYLDGAELIQGYDPTAGGGSKLSENDLVTTYTNATQSYSVMYPISWLRQKTGENDVSVTFTADTNEFFQVIVEENPERLSPKEWYLEQSPGVAASQVEEIIVGNLIGVKSPDSLTVYLGKTNMMYILNYSLASQTEANFLSTFEMFYSNFKLTSTVSESCAEGTCPVNENTNTNTNTNSNTNTNANSNRSGPAPALNNEPLFPE